MMGPAAFAQHRGDARKKSKTPCEPVRMWNMREPIGPAHPGDLQRTEREDDSADDWLVEVFIQPMHPGPRRNHSHAGWPQHPPNVVPTSVLAKGEHGANVANDEHRQHNPGGIPRAEEKRENQDMNHAHSGETAFGYANAQR
jgi:hypothetical protein